MEVIVKFRFNKLTGEVEEFDVDDVASSLPAAEHNREHERIAAEIGRVLERNPRLVELDPNAPAPVPAPPEQLPEAASEPQRERSS